MGEDQIGQFRFDPATGRLVPNEPSIVETAADEGPRHFVVSPNNKHVYVLNELTGTVAHFAMDSDNGTLKPVGTAESIPPGSDLVRGVVGAPVTAEVLAGRGQDQAAPSKPKIQSADIQMTANGRFLFPTERASSKIALFGVDADTGAPTYVADFATVARPRGIRIDPSDRFLVASGETSDVVAVYRIDDATGRLLEAGRFPGGRGANWVEIVDPP